MSERVGLLAGNNINTDNDLSSHIDSIATAGVIEGLVVSSNSVSAGKAFVEVVRTATSPDETFYVVFELVGTKSITLDSNQYVYIEIDQDKINNGAGSAEDGTGIGEIKVSGSLPITNYIELARTDGIGDIITENRQSLKLKGDLLDDNVASNNIKGGNWKVYYTNGTGKTEESSLGTASQVWTSNGPEVAPSWNSPSVDIGGLDETTTIDSADEFIVNQTGNKKITRDNLTENLKEATEITKGVVRKTTDEEFKLGSDVNAYITPGQTASSILPSDNILLKQTNAIGGSNTTYSKQREANCNKSGEYRVAFTLYSSSGGSTVYGRIYKNGVAFGTERSTTSSSAVRYTEDLDFESGDLIQVYFRSGGGANWQSNEFSIGGTQITTSFLPTI